MNLDQIYFTILFPILIIGVVGFGYLTNQKYDNEKRYAFLFVTIIFSTFWPLALAALLIYIIIIYPLIYLGKRIPKLKFLDSLLDKFPDI